MLLYQTENSTGEDQLETLNKKGVSKIRPELGETIAKPFDGMVFKV